ncbi:ABC transporter substrate-binding protein [Pararhizobium mangrovi]|uniref:Amino acid ABC transporter substrate-binding protein n=1 Tax=Pararhizobium mangrovi TaxID=2590452 RepID=A0A506U212_9HYPH|nr:ABC transporter substrate-binding protein [Pararhizobium mangrovi]TPW26609.1 amino acid ABC transporter substrate-binding protein [Pararhizobium mangrovi]
MMSRTRTALFAGAALMAFAGAANAADTVKIGVLGGITGPIESLAQPIVDGSKAAMKEINSDGGLWDSGAKLQADVGDTTCSDATKAADAGDRAVNVDKVVAIMGAMCSGATIAVANNAAIPGGVAMISPASTSPALTDLKDKNLVFRTVTSDAYQGQVLARMVKDKGVNSVAVTYVNNDYGKGFAEAFQTAFKKDGGEVTAMQAHEDNKADYRSEIGNLSASGADALVVLAYADGSGQTILRQALEGGDFQKFFGGDGMVAASLTKNVPGIEGKLTMTKPSASDTPGKSAYESAMKKAGVDADGTFVANAYDATYILAMALEKAGSADRAKVAAAIPEVAKGPGEKIMPGEWAKAKKLIDAGKDVNYEGATGPIDFDQNGDVPGVYDEVVLADGKVKDNGQIKMDGSANGSSSSDSQSSN